MEKSSAYTLDDIEKETGFDKRTIAYYVQEGLVPKVGRRGPKTRYPQVFLDRLMFVRMIREKQDAGEVGQLTSERDPQHSRPHSRRNDRRCCGRHGTVSGHGLPFRTRRPTDE